MSAPGMDFMCRTASLASRRRWTPWLASALLLLAAPTAWAAPSIWDQDQDDIDDRVESVSVLGFRYAFEDSDTTARKRIEVTQTPGGLVFGVYILYSQTPNDSDLIALTLLGLKVLHRFEAVPAVRTVATLVQVQAAAELPHVVRVDAVPILYPLVHEGAAAMGVRDPTQQVFPTWAGTGGAQGHGVVVAILDTGVNDQAAEGYPGHESLLGRCLGGASFVAGDSTLDTPRDGSVNPVDHGGSATATPGTHVAGIILGSGGPTGYAAGIAPEARFVDVKVLGDGGVGTGVPEGLDWCIHNRTRDWGGHDPSYSGIDVINLSLSSFDQTDGNDLASLLANRAAELGIVVVASMGNDGHVGYVPSPAGADRVLAVAAYDDQRTGPAGDDEYAFFDNQGPRANDGDGDSADEQKPDLLAPGVNILSADGDLASDGRGYHRLSGTSMAAAFVSGAVAALRSAYPGLGPSEIAELLHATSNRLLAGGSPSGGTDPRWDSRIGFGGLDLYAARLEAEQPERSQIRRLALAARDTVIEATLWTQRERGAAHFTFERAADVGGVPGPFDAIDSVDAIGDSSLADPFNLTSYTRVWPVPPAELGTPFWYRVSYSEGGARYSSPARSLASPTGPSVATVEFSIAHNAFDTDVSGDIGVPGGTGLPPQWSAPVPGTAAAVASDWVNGTSLTGNVEWTFRIPVPAGAADDFLPPSPAAPWQLSLHEGGFLNRSGRVTGLRLIWHAPGGDQVYEGGPVPQQTVENSNSSVWIPAFAVDVAGTAVPRFQLSPNPVAAGGPIRLALSTRPESGLEIFDLAGRRVGNATFTTVDGAFVATWVARAADGSRLSPGVYFLRAGASFHGRIIVLSAR
jgi:serine protease AprX